MSILQKPEIKLRDTKLLAQGLAMIGNLKFLKMKLYFHKSNIFVYVFISGKWRQNLI